MDYSNIYCQQYLIEEKFVVPEAKPDLEQILNAVIEPKLERVNFKKHMVVFIGELVVKVEYIARTSLETQPVHYISFKVPFGNFLKLKGDLDKYHKNISYVLEHMELTEINERIIAGTMILRVCIRKKTYKPNANPCCNINNEVKTAIKKLPIPEMACQPHEIESGIECDLLLKCFPNCPLILGSKE